MINHIVPNIPDMPLEVKRSFRATLSVAISVLTVMAFKIPL